MVFLLPSPAIDFATPGRKWCWHTTNSLQMTGDLMLIICWRRESCGLLTDGDWDAFVSRQSEVSERRADREYSKAGKMISECNVADNRQENEYFIWPELLTRAICMSGGDRRHRWMTALSSAAALRHYHQILSVTRHSHPYVAQLHTLSSQLSLRRCVYVYTGVCVCSCYLMSLCLALHLQFFFFFFYVY